MSKIKILITLVVFLSCGFLIMSYLYFPISTYPKTIYDYEGSEIVFEDIVYKDAQIFNEENKMKYRHSIYEKIEKTLDKSNITNVKIIFTNKPFITEFCGRAYKEFGNLIVIQPKECGKTLDWVIAHEIGHLKDDSYFGWDYYLNPCKHERFADSFADNITRYTGLRTERCYE